MRQLPRLTAAFPDRLMNRMEGMDAATVARARAGDGDAFRALVERHSRSIFRLAYRMTGNEHDAEDVVQETFLRAYRRLNRFQSRSDFGTWLYRIAVNCCLNWRKRRQRQDQTHQEWGRQEAEVAHDDTRRAQQIQEALMKLPTKQRAAIVLTTYDGLTHAEAARALGCSETTVSWRLFAARAKIKRLLKHLQKTGGAV